MATPRMKRSTRASWAIGSKIVVASSTRPSSTEGLGGGAADSGIYLRVAGQGQQTERLRRCLTELAKVFDGGAPNLGVYLRVAGQGQ